jgi:hypothetical protein
MRSVQIGFSGGKCCNVIDLSKYHFEALRNDDEFTFIVGRGSCRPQRWRVVRQAFE